MSPSRLCPSFNSIIVIIPNNITYTVPMKYKVFIFIFNVLLIITTQRLSENQTNSFAKYVNLQLPFHTLLRIEFRQILS